MLCKRLATKHKLTKNSAKYGFIQTFCQFHQPSIPVRRTVLTPDGILIYLKCTLHPVQKIKGAKSDIPRLFAFFVKTHS